jgi:phospholipid/cholesterol/gamma-HCH transport system permease protein
MQVNEELDALKTMGISKTDFLILPRLLSLVLSMPFLVILADFIGIIGGGVVGIFMLDISLEEYWKFSVEAFDLTNFLVGVFHGFIFGFVIALCGCYFGVKTGRNADSVGIATTKAVVSGIVWMIVMTGIITLICEVLNI